MTAAARIATLTGAWLLAVTPQAPAQTAEGLAIEGVWERVFAAPGAATMPPPDPGPKLRPEHRAIWEQRLAEIRAADARGVPIATSGTLCLPTGMPSMMGGVGNFPNEILISDGQVTIIQEAYTQVRRIYLDTPQLTLDDVEPGYYGRSVGRWEGDTLVVETIGIREDVRYREVPHSRDMRIVERIHLAGPDILWDEITIIDPAVLEEPWQFTFALRRMPDYEMLEYVCEDNREYVDEAGGTHLRVE